MANSFIPVRPRVVAASIGESELLTDALERIEGNALAQGRKVGVRILGLGRKTALKHLQMQQLVKAGQGTGSKSAGFAPYGDSVEVSILPTVAADIELQLASWSTDELIEYLLANHADKCNQVMERVLSEGAQLGGAPYIWQPVLDRMARHENAESPTLAALGLFELEFTTHKSLKAKVLERVIHFGPAGFFHQKELVAELGKLACVLLRINETRDEILGAHIAERLERKDRHCLKPWMSGNLLTVIARNVSGNAKAEAVLERCVRKSSVAGVASSILLQMNRKWRPKDKLSKLDLSEGEFQNANWKSLRLQGTKLRFAKLHQAKLQESIFIGCDFHGTKFVEADLEGSDLALCRSLNGDFALSGFRSASISNGEFRQCRFTRANLEGALLSESRLVICDLEFANLSLARFSKCRIYRCNLSDAELENCTFEKCYLSSIDFGNRSLDDISFAESKLHACDFECTSMERVNFHGARLANALFTDSVASRCDLKNSILRGAGLAGVHWTNCNLRGANLSNAAFHLGSSRAGIVDSPFPSHGTRTGFYNDDIEDMDCKPPEAIRKAALIDCDMHGANLDNADFYLVDLRGSLFDEKYRGYLKGCGAILE